jgi:hypothetical protein
MTTATDLRMESNSSQGRHRIGGLFYDVGSADALSLHNLVIFILILILILILIFIFILVFRILILVFRFRVQGIGLASIDNPVGPLGSYKILVDDFARRGFVTLRVDKPGCGDSEASGLVCGCSVRGENATAQHQNARFGLMWVSAGPAPLSTRQVPFRGQDFPDSQSLDHCLE